MSVSAHPLLSCRFPAYLDLLRTYGFDFRYAPKVLGTGLAILAREPVTLLNTLRFRSKIAGQDIQPDPVFLIGHWRSGTTHLQNLLNCDPQFGRVPLLQAAMPGEYLSLTPGQKLFLGRMLPSTRLMDNMKIAAEVPWEEELAMTATGRYSFYHVSFFPKAMEKIFAEAVLFSDGNPDKIREWETQYRNFLKQVQFTQPGKPLLLKNPANTARISLLRKQFPNAKFIHLHRDPYKVFASTVHLYEQAHRAWGLQESSREQIVDHVLAAYPQLMQRYFAQRDSVPPGDLVEISFTNLQEDPHSCLKCIYQKLNLDGFETALPHFEKYLEGQRDYKKNVHNLLDPDKKRVAKEWKPFFDRMGYEP